jgi:hypothetical protein
MDSRIGTFAPIGSVVGGLVPKIGFRAVDHHLKRAEEANDPDAARAGIREAKAILGTMAKHGMFGEDIKEAA